MTYTTGPQGQQAPMIDELPPDRRMNLPNGTSVYVQRESSWFMAVDGVLQPYQPKSGRGRLIAVLSVFGAIIVAIIALVVVNTIKAGPMFGGGPTLTAAEAECNKGRSGADLADGGKTLIIDLRGTSPAEQIRGAMDADTFGCIMAKLEVPTSVTSHIQGTRALDGQQTDSWDGFSARWTYHPDHGLQMTIEQK